MDNWEKFSETSPPEKEDFYSHLNMEVITDEDYKQAKRVCKDLKYIFIYVFSTIMFEVTSYCWLVYLRTFWNLLKYMN